MNNFSLPYIDNAFLDAFQAAWFTYRNALPLQVLAISTVNLWNNTLEPKLKCPTIPKVDDWLVSLVHDAFTGMGTLLDFDVFASRNFKSREECVHALHQLLRNTEVCMEYALGSLSATTQEAHLVNVTLARTTLFENRDRRDVRAAEVTYNMMGTLQRLRALTTMAMSLHASLARAGELRDGSYGVRVPKVELPFAPEELEGLLDMPVYRNLMDMRALQEKAEASDTPTIAYLLLSFNGRLIGDIDAQAPTSSHTMTSSPASTDLVEELLKGDLPDNQRAILERALKAAKGEMTPAEAEAYANKLLEHLSNKLQES